MERVGQQQGMGIRSPVSRKYTDNGILPLSFFTDAEVRTFTGFNKAVLNGHFRRNRTSADALCKIFPVY